ncbi:MAG: MASE1 domain-containing protein, partial [Gemmatimonadota bacterium]
MRKKISTLQQSDWVRHGAVFLLTYLACTWIGLRFLHPGLPVSPFWPAAGIAIAGVALLGPWVAALIVVAELVLNIGTQPLWVSLVIGLGNAAEAIVAGQLYCRLTHRECPPTSLKALAAFTLSVALGASVAATLGVCALRGADVVIATSPAELWLTWLAADVLSGVLIGTLLLAWFSGECHPPTFRRAAELTGVLAFVAAIGWVIFVKRSGSGSHQSPIPFVVFPGLAWAAFRFGQRGASAAAVVLWIIALYATMLGKGPFAAESPIGSMLATQGFIAVLGLTGLAVGGEVTRRQLSERRLEHSEARYRSLIAHSPEAICVVDALTGQLTDANAAAEQLFLMSRDALTATGLSQLSAPIQPGGRDAEETIRALLAGAMLGRSQRFEWLHRRQDGSTVPCEMRLMALPGSDLLVRASIVDLSDRPFFAQVTVLESLVRGAPLDDALAQLASLLEAQIPDGRAAMFVFDPATHGFKVVAAPSFAPEFVGSVIGHSALDAGPVGTAKREGVAHEVPDVFEADGWERIRPLAARWGFHAIWIWPCSDAEGGIIGAVAMLFAERARPSPGQRALLGMAASLGGLALQRDSAEEALRSAEAHLRQAQKMEAVGRLAGGVAHDFNNLLTVIGGATELLAEDPGIDAGALEELKMIREATARAAGLTRQLCAFSRQQPWQPTRID